MSIIHKPILINNLGEYRHIGGFLLMAFDDDNANNDSIGSFFLPSDGQVISCSTGTPNNVMRCSYFVFTTHNFTLMSDCVAGRDEERRHAQIKWRQAVRYGLLETTGIFCRIGDFQVLETRRNRFLLDHPQFSSCRTTYLRNGTVFWVNIPAASPVQVVNVTTTTVSPGSTSTELTPPTTLLSTVNRSLLLKHTP